MRWGIKAHAVYESRFWTKDGLSGQISTDGGLVRTTADNSPPSGEPGILVAFVEENEARALQGAAASERQHQLIGELVRYFGPDASQPVRFFERNWGEDAFCRGIDGGYWPVGVWSRYGSALRKPFGRIHWAGARRRRGGIFSHHARRFADWARASPTRSHRQGSILWKAMTA
jgi:monoamine oxidase